MCSIALIYFVFCFSMSKGTARRWSTAWRPIINASNLPAPRRTGAGAIEGVHP